MYLIVYHLFHNFTSVGLAGKTSIEQAMADQAADCLFNDLFEKYVAFAFYETDEKRKDDMKSKYLAETLPFFCGRLEKILQDNGGEYFTGSVSQ